MLSVYVLAAPLRLPYSPSFSRDDDLVCMFPKASTLRAMFRQGGGLSMLLHVRHSL